MGLKAHSPWQAKKILKHQITRQKHLLHIPKGATPDIDVKISFEKINSDHSIRALQLPNKRYEDDKYWHIQYTLHSVSKNINICMAEVLKNRIKCRQMIYWCNIGMASWLSMLLMASAGTLSRRISVDKGCGTSNCYWYQPWQPWTANRMYAPLRTAYMIHLKSLKTSSVWMDAKT